MGPSAGVFLLSSSQKPSGVGAGDVQRLFNRYRDNHQLRFGLRCGNRDVSNAILGNEAYGEGYDCSGLPLGDKYRGVGILYGLQRRSPDRPHIPRGRRGRRGHPARRAQAAGEGWDADRGAR